MVVINGLLMGKLKVYYFDSALSDYFSSHTAKVRPEKRPSVK